MKKLLYIVIGLFIVFWWFQRQLFSPVDTDRQPVTFAIQRSQSFSDILDSLKEKELIRSTSVLSLYARARGLDRNMKAGRFDIDPNFSPVEVLAFLSNPSSGQLTVTIPEGYSIYDIDERLAELGITQAGEFTAWAKQENAEGMLFPDTYFVTPGDFTAASFGKYMKRTFEQKVVRDLAPDFKESKHSLQEIIIMASILEKEARHAEDAPIIAGILWKRIENDWPLQTDATLLYGDPDRTVTSKKLQTDTPYNTYTRKGLPVGPIGNPGLLMIKAALHPQESPYWFYLTDKDGRAQYGVTNADHEANKDRYL